MQFGMNSFNPGTMKHLVQVSEITKYVNEYIARYQMPFRIENKYATPKKGQRPEFTLNTALLFTGTNQYTYVGELGDIHSCLQAILNFYALVNPALGQQAKRVLDQLVDDIDKKFGSQPQALPNNNMNAGFGGFGGMGGFGEQGPGQGIGAGFGFGGRGPGFGGPGYNQFDDPFGD